MDDAPVFSADELLTQAGWARALARRLVVDEARADDLLQRAWLAARATPVRERRSPRAWLAGVLRHMASKQRRDDERRAAREKIAALAEAQPSSSSVVAELEAQRLVVDALLRLDEPYRETLVRRWYRDEKPAAIARAMGVPVRTVDTRLARGLERLRAELTALRGGGGREWGLALMPLALHAPAAKAAVVLGSLAAGVATMSTVSKLAAAALMVAAAWWGMREWSDARPAAARGAVDGSATAAVVAATNDRQRALSTAAVRATEGEAPRLPPKVDPTAGTMLVHLVDSDGIDVESASFALVAGDRYLATGALQPGIAPRMESPPVDAMLVVRPICRSDHVGAAPCAFAVAAGTKSLELALPRGAVLSGQLLCDGQEPGIPIPLVFDAEVPFSALKDVFDPVRLRMGRSKSSRVEVLADAAGRFRITGLEGADRGTLTLPDGWSTQPITREVDGRLRTIATLPIPSPTEGLSIELFAEPAIVGSLVDGAGARVESFRWVVQGKAASGSFSSRGYAWKSPTFRIPLPVATASTVDVFFDRQDSDSIHLHLDGPFDRTRDIGEVRLLANRVVHLRVTDLEGREVGEVFGDAIGPMEEHRDVRGEGADVTITAPPIFTRARIGCLGYLPAEVELPAQGSDVVIPVRLQKTTELCVKLEPASLRNTPGLALEVAARGSLFEPPMATLGLVGAWKSSATGASCDVVDGWTVARVTPGGDGDSVYGLVAGVPIRVRLRGPAGHVGFETTVVLTAGESHDLLATVADSVRRFTGRVVARDDESVAGAVVELRPLARDENYGSLSTTTSQDGTFIFDALLGDFTGLSVVHPGFVSLDLPNFRLPASDEPITLRLERGWPLRVRVVDVAGRPLDDARVTARAITAAGVVIEKACDGWPDGPGKFRFEDLAAGNVRVRVELAGAAYEQDAAPPTASLRFEVPEHGRVVVRYDLPIPEVAKRGRVMGAIELAPREGRGTRVAIDATLFEPPRRTGAVEFPAVLPGSYELVLVWRDDDGHDLEREATAQLVGVFAGETRDVALRQ